MLCAFTACAAATSASQCHAMCSSRDNAVYLVDVTVTGVTVNHGKIPDSEGYHLSFNYQGNRHDR